MKKCTTIAITLLFIFTSQFVYPAGYAIWDLGKSDKAYNAVKNVVSQNLMSLSKVNKRYYFYPNNKIKRGEFAKILAAANSDNSFLLSPSHSSYKDVSTKSPYFRYIETEKAYIPAFNSYYKPDFFITREMATVAIVKAMGYDSKEAIKNGVKQQSSLKDILDDQNKISLNKQKYISIAIRNNLINVTKEGSLSLFRPKEYLTRRELAVTLDASIKLGDFSKKSNNISPGKNQSDLPKDKTAFLINGNKLNYDFCDSQKVSFSFRGIEQNQETTSKYSKASDCAVIEQNVDGELSTTFLNKIHSPNTASMFLYNQGTDTYSKVDKDVLQDTLSNPPVDNILQLSDKDLGIIADNSALTGNGNKIIMKSEFDENNIWPLNDTFATLFRNIDSDNIKGVSFTFTFVNKKITGVKMDIQLADLIQTGEIIIEHQMDYSKQNVTEFFPPSL